MENRFKKDYQENPRRFVIETISWILSVGGSALFAITSDHANLLMLYPLWISGCLMAAYCAYLRNSLPNMLNYLALAAIDGLGLVNFILRMP